MWATLTGVIVGFALGEGSRLFRNWWRVRELRQALRADDTKLSRYRPSLGSSSEPARSPHEVNDDGTSHVACHLHPPGCRH
jgi:hypothetical protein